MAWRIDHALIQFGPHSPRSPRGLSFARAYCARVVRESAENFPVASVLLPRKLLTHFHAVYAFCRWADDLADETGTTENAQVLLRWWRLELQHCYAGKVWHPVFVALQETIRTFAIPQEYFARLLKAFERDQTQTTYPTFDDLLSYCRDSADPVGRIVLHLYGCPREDSFAYSDAVCTGLQLANFWQDVSRDYDKGRVYIPVEDRKRFGYSENDLSNKRMTPAFADLLQFEVNRTQRYFELGKQLVPLLPSPRNLDVSMFIQGGEAVLRAIEKQRYDVWAARPRITKWTKVKLLVHAMYGRMG